MDPPTLYENRYELYSNTLPTVEKIWMGLCSILGRIIATKDATISDEYYALGFLWEKLLYHAVFLQ